MKNNHLINIKMMIKATKNNSLSNFNKNETNQINKDQLFYSVQIKENHIKTNIFICWATADERMERFTRHNET